jgi:hypothetical protein
MGSIRRSATLLAAVILVAGTVPGAGAASPAAANASVKVSGNGNFHLEREENLRDGRVVGHFRSPEGTVDTIGRPGMNVTINVTDTTSAAEPNKRHGSIEISFQSPDVDKSAPGAAESHAPSAVASLIALGVDPAIAKRDFAAFDSPQPSAKAITATLASVRTPSTQPTPTKDVSSTVPWDIQCANLSYASGKITGRGCSSLYLISASGTDYWFQSKYQITASSSDTSLFPVRVKGLGWRLQWASTNNNVYEWEPHTTTYGTDACNSVWFNAEVIGISIALCRVKEIPWSVSQVSSGALWSGTEKDTDPVGAGGVQSNHNPPSASTSHSSTFSLSW